MRAGAAGWGAGFSVDGKAFDAATRRLAEGGSRRRVLGLLGGAVAALTIGGRRRAAAQTAAEQRARCRQFVLSGGTSPSEPIEVDDNLFVYVDQEKVFGRRADRAGAIQPIVMRDGLKNLQVKGFYSWEPTSLLGIYRLDELFWDRADRRLAEAQ